MSVMNREIYEALLAAKVPDEQARAAAQSVGHSAELATKTDLAQLETRMTRWTVTLVAPIYALLVAVLFAVLRV